MKEKDVQILAGYFPEKALDLVVVLIEKYRVHFKIAKNRRTKLGDYRPPVKNRFHQISVNHDLNPYAFLITFVHEMAHLLVFERYGLKISAPHGKEWKKEYRQLMQRFIDLNIFPDDLKKELEKSIVNSKASSLSEMGLYRILKKYDQNSSIEEDVIDLEKLPEGTVFYTKNGLRFQKGEKQRVRYRCFNLDNKQWYLFHPLTPVKVWTEN